MRARRYLTEPIVQPPLTRAQRRQQLAQRAARAPGRAARALQQRVGAAPISPTIQAAKGMAGRAGRGLARAGRFVPGGALAFGAIDAGMRMANGEDAGRAIGGAAASTIGATLGGILGQALIPVPGLGAAVGMAAGGFLGDKIFSSIVGPAQVQKQAAAMQLAAAQQRLQSQKDTYAAVVQDSSQPLQYFYGSVEEFRKRLDYAGYANNQNAQALISEYRQRNVSLEQYKIAQQQLTSFSRTLEATGTPTRVQSKRLAELNAAVAKAKTAYEKEQKELTAKFAQTPQKITDAIVKSIQTGLTTAQMDAAIAERIRQAGDPTRSRPRPADRNVGTTTPTSNPQAFGRQGPPVPAYRTTPVNTRGGWRADVTSAPSPVAVEKPGNDIFSKFLALFTSINQPSAPKPAPKPAGDGAGENIAKLGAAAQQGASSVGTATQALSTSATKSSETLTASSKSQGSIFSKIASLWQSTNVNSGSKLQGSASGLATAINNAANKIRNASAGMGSLGTLATTGAERRSSVAGAWDGNTRRRMSLGEAISQEEKHMPSGSHLVIANSSETIIPANKGLNLEGLAGGMDRFRGALNGLASMAEEFGGMGGAQGNLASAHALAKRFGLMLTSFKRNGPASASYHNVGRAMDFSNGTGPTPQMLAYARMMAARYGRSLTELIYTPLGFGIKHGKKVAPYAASSHYNHVHVAYGMGAGNPAFFTSSAAADKWEMAMARREPIVSSVRAKASEVQSGPITINAPITIYQQPNQDSDSLASVVIAKLGMAVDSIRNHTA